jgi:26S proteasome regulatory subunit N2
LQPTGGVLLVTDTRPSEKKELIELKARKMVKAAAPTNPTAAPTLSGEPVAPSTPGGAQEAAGVLTAIDEDQEGGEEAVCPGEFDYWSDGE